MAAGDQDTSPTSPTEVGSDADAAHTPTTIAAPDRYQLVERLGEGGMGVVWKAHDVALDRTVALKVLHDRFLGSGHQAGLAAEARTMAKLSHPNVVVVYDVGEREGRTFLTMELVTGQPLSRWLETPIRARRPTAS